MKRPHNRTHCSAPEKGIGRNKGVLGAPSSFFLTRLFQRQKISKQFSSSTIVSCGRLSHLDSALPIGEVFYWASSSCPSQNLRIVKEEHILLWLQVWCEQSRWHWWTGELSLLMNWSNTRILIALLSCKCSAKCISWHHCFCPHCFHFLCSLLHAKPGYIVGRIAEVENAWCLMFCYFDFVIAVSIVERALIAADTRWERH